MRPALAVIGLLALIAACRNPAAHLPLAPSQTFRQAEDALARKEYAAAAQTYQRYLRTAPDALYVPRAYYQLAAAQYHQHQYQETLATLDELKDRFPGRSWVQALALRGDAELGLGKRVAALLAWEEAWLQAGPNDQPRLRTRLVSVSEQLTDAEREEASQLVVVPPVREALGLAELPALAEAPAGIPPLASADEVAPSEQRRPAEPDLVAAASASAIAESKRREPSGAAEVVSASPSVPAVEAVPGAEAVAATEPVAATETVASGSEFSAPAAEPEPNTKVACLLPLTGADRAYGQRTLAGLRLAFADAPKLLEVRDTGGDPKTSAALFERLRDDPKVVAVIGPLRSKEAEATAPLAERAQLPLLLLSQREGLTGRFVLQAAMTRAQQVELLVGYAVDTLKLQRFAVVYPNDSYGAGFTEVFKDAVTRHRGKIVGTQPYEPGDPDADDVTATVKRWHTAGLDALLIPDAAATAAFVAAEVRRELPDIVLLGTESWNAAATLAEMGAALNGAVFADAFFADSPRPSTREFVERFEQVANRPPTVFEAQAFDAGRAVRQAISAGATSRDEIIFHLTELGRIEGAGRLRATAGGFERTLSLLRYSDGKVEEISSR